jgi:hypothetical protein
LDLLRKRKLDAKDKNTKINPSDKNKVNESTDEICDLAEPSEVPSDGHGEMLPNPTQVSSQDPPQDNAQVTGL